MKDFKAGRFIRTGTGYQAFLPEKINRSYLVDDPALILLHEKASHRLGELNAYSELAPDVEQFIKLHVVKEATLSSRIEGTRTEMEEALMEEADILPERRDDWREVNNYIRALTEGIELLKTLPLSSRFIKKIHAALLSGVRGERKMPGEFRRSQNWIGGATLADAAFIPPEWQEINDLMNDLEKFLHSYDTGLPTLFKIALVHYQFETIHPFLDGNGRVGRLLIPIFLIESGMLSQPTLYISEFFEKNRSIYYDNLTRVRTHNDLNQWLKFFLVGVEQTCLKGCTGLKAILRLKTDCETERLPQLGRKMPQAAALLRYLFSNPVVKPDQVSEVTNLSVVSTYKLLNDFQRLGILREISGKGRNQVFAFDAYLNIFLK